MYLGEVCLIFSFLLIGYFVWARRKSPSQTKEFEITGKFLRFFSSGVVYILKICREKFQWQMKQDKLGQLKKIHVGKSETEIFYVYYGKLTCKLAGAIVVGLVLVSISGIISQKSKLIEGYFLEKEGVLGTDKSVQLQAKVEGKEHEVTVQVPKTEYSKEKLEEKFTEAINYIDHTYLGENSSAQKVSQPLNLIGAVPDNAISVTWNLGSSGLIELDGSVVNDDIDESQQVQITAILSYGDIERSIVKMLTILPMQRTKEELFWKEWQNQLEKNTKESASEQYLELPQTIKGTDITYREEKTSITYTILVMVVFFIIIIPLLSENGVRKEVLRREEELRNAYPDFVEHFVLLIGAGLNIKGAWERIVNDYLKGQARDCRKYLYEEMLVSMREMDNGISEARAYELFGKRTGLLQYMKFCTLIVQNLKKGSDDLLKVLEYEVADAFRERKENAKTLGEKAGTKLLLPMMLMLLIVFVLILYAAFRSI